MVCPWTTLLYIKVFTRLKFYVKTPFWKIYSWFSWWNGSWSLWLRGSKLCFFSVWYAINENELAAVSASSSVECVEMWPKCCCKRLPFTQVILDWEVIWSKPKSFKCPTHLLHSIPEVQMKALHKQGRSSSAHKSVGLWLTVAREEQWNPLYSGSCGAYFVCFTWDDSCALWIPNVWSNLCKHEAAGDLPEDGS